MKDMEFTDPEALLVLAQNEERMLAYLPTHQPPLVVKKMAFKIASNPVNPDLVGEIMAGVWVGITLGLLIAKERKDTP